MNFANNTKNNVKNMITAKERRMAPFRSLVLDRVPMWYSGAPDTTKNIISHLGASDEHEAFYEKLHMDYVTFRPEYIGVPFEKLDDGTFYNEWGIRRG